MPDQARDKPKTTENNDEFIKKLAEKVYRLMLADLKLSKLRGDTGTTSLRR